MTILKQLESIGSRGLSILIARFLFGMTFKEIGKEYGVSRERIRQIIERVLDQTGLWFPEIHWARRHLVGFRGEHLLFLNRELARKDQELKTVFGNINYLEECRRAVCDMLIEYCSGNPILSRKDTGSQQTKEAIYQLIDEYNKGRKRIGAVTETLKEIEKKVKAYFTYNDGKEHLT